MKKWLSVFVVILLSACAYSPQQITIDPRIKMDGENYGGGRSLTVEAVDERPKKILGSRGGVYEDTSIITIENDMTQAIVRATQAMLATQGFNVHAADSTAKLTVVVEELTYDLTEPSLAKKVDLSCKLRVDVVAGTESYTGRYRTSSSQEMVISPNMERNEQMVNQVLSDTLARAFSDPKLKAFLSNI